MTGKGEASARLDAYGVDAVCEDIGNELSLRGIAAKLGVSPGSLLTWIEADAERSARVREVRQAMGRHWDEKSESVIRDAEDEFALKKAKELAHHYRWRAKAVAPKEYGDKVQTEHSGGVTVTHEQFLASLK